MPWFEIAGNGRCPIPLPEATDCHVHVIAPQHGIHTDSGTELPFQATDMRGLLNLLPRWLEDDTLIKRVLVENPARLYEF
jgi:hypothetical protein